MTVKFKDMTTAEKGAVVFLSVFIALVENWVYMIALGTLHSFFNFVPALSFIATLIWNIVFVGFIRLVVRQEIKKW